VAVGALALGSATLAGQHAHSAPAGAAASNPAHTHIGHVMTMWKDTPNTQGFLPVAVIAQTNSIANGMDANKDGSIGWQTGEGGLAQAQTHMDLMVKGEGL